MNLQTARINKYKKQDQLKGKNASDAKVPRYDSSEIPSYLHSRVAKHIQKHFLLLHSLCITVSEECVCPRVQTLNVTLDVALAVPEISKFLRLKILLRIFLVYWEMR
jgi:hypothetical protein